MSGDGYGVAQVRVRFSCRSATDTPTGARIVGVVAFMLMSFVLVVIGCIYEPWHVIGCTMLPLESNEFVRE